MNDLMTKSFLSYVDLKNQAQKDLEAEHDLEAGRLNPTNDENLCQFFQEVAPIKASMEEITSLFSVTDIQKSLTRLHQVFLDMAVLVEAQVEQIDDIEENVATASNYISGGTNSLYYANQMRKKTKT